MRFLLLSLSLFVLIFAGILVASDDGRGGYHAYENGDYIDALQELTPLAERDDIEAQLILGIIYGDGLIPYEENAEATATDRTEDTELAALWFGRAAEQGSAQAQYRLGQIYARGEGLDQDLKQAFVLLKQAADQGFAPAQNDLGDMYRLGKGAPQDLARARGWYEKAAEQRLAAAQYNMGMLHYRIAENAMVKSKGLAKIMRDGKIGRAREAYLEAESWLYLSANQDHGKAQFYLGHLYHVGKGVQRDFTVASRWYQEAAKQNIASALYQLSWMAKEGRGLKKDKRIAKKYLKRAAAQGHPEAQYDMGLLFAKSSEFIRAHMWFDLAAQHPGQDGIEERDIMAEKLTLTQVKVAERLAEECIARNYKGC